MTAFWFALEGGEACGKSTQAARLAERLGALATREPGATPIGEALRTLMLDPATGALDPRTETLLMAADRAEHVSILVNHALAAGQHVVSDRSAWSSLAYQGFGRGVPLDDVRRISDWATAGRWPDLALLIDVPADTAAARLVARPDRFEAAGDGFHQRVREGFLALAAQEPARWAVIDGTGGVEEVEARVAAAVDRFIEENQ